MAIRNSLLRLFALGLLSVARPAAADPPTSATPSAAAAQYPPERVPVEANAPLTTSSAAGDTPGAPLASPQASANPTIGVSHVAPAGAQAAPGSSPVTTPRTSPAPNSWTQHLPTNAPLPRFEQSMAFDAGHSQDVLFGGYTAAGACLNDTWLWSGSTSSWSQAVSPGCTSACPNIPSPRSNPAMAYDGAHVLLFGGTAADGTELSDTWTWDGTSWTQQSPTVIPASRDSAGVAFDAAHSKVVLFGGCAGYVGGGCAAVHGDTWVWDGSARTWTSICLCGPSARFGAGLAFDGAEIVVFGGHDGSFLADTRTFDGSTWTAVCGTSGQSGCGPHARDYMGMAFDQKTTSALLYSGFDGTNTFGQQILFNDTWSFSAGTWTQLCGQFNNACAAGERTQFAMAWDGMRAIAFGGEEIPTVAPTAPQAVTAGDTWGWDGTTWTEGTAGEPRARDAYAMAYDATHQQAVLFGGQNQTLNAIFCDTWTWDGTNWTLRQPVPSPPTRDFAAMAWDGSKLVLFGGIQGFSRGQANLLSDTWTWDGATWTPRCGTTTPSTPPCGPSAREGAVMA
jgi:hypothetical protein